MTRHIFRDDRIVLKSLSEEAMVRLRQYLFTNPELALAIQLCYEKYHIVDTTRPISLRTLNFTNDPLLLPLQIEKVFTQLWNSIPCNFQESMAYLPDIWVLEVGMVHAALDMT